jgi:tetratricopeptide (TPR) repeat protein
MNIGEFLIGIIVETVIFLTPWVNWLHKHRRRIIGGVLVVLAAGLLFGRPYYRQIKERHSVKQAQAFLERHDFRSAYLSARQALLINSNNVQACGIMVKLADVAQSPTALDWQRRVVELDPTIENKLLLASTGLRYQSPPFPLTTKILGELPGAATNHVEFYVVSSELALRMNRIADAQSFLESASRLQPTNLQFQMNIAVIRLGSTNPAESSGGRAALKGFLADTNYTPQALRSLVADCMVQKDLPGAFNYSTQLLASAQSTVGDRLQHLTILQQLQSAELPAQLKIAQQQSATNSAAAAATASWMIASGRSTDAADWLNSLNTAIRSQSPVRLALVNCYFADTNWLALMNFTSKGDWDEMDFLREAYLSHAWAQLDDPGAADGQWSAAVAKAGVRFGALTTLLGLANRWGLQREREDLLWQITKLFPAERGAWQELERDLFVAGDTRKLNQLYALLLSFFPQNADIKNNLAVTSLLLKTNLNQAYAWANEVHEQKPDDPGATSTYAYALHLQGRTQEGVEAMEKLKKDALEQPSIALYFGVLLSAAGEPDKAAHFLALARSGNTMLPEEKQLLSEVAGAP